MILHFDQYAYLDTVIHRWNPKYKLIALMILIFSFSFINDLRLIPLMLGICAVLFIISGLPFTFLLSRLRLPGAFIIMLGVILPFFSGHTVIFQLGPLAVRQEGCFEFLVISGKFFCIMTTGIILFGTTPFLTMVKAMRSLGLPLILADMTLFAYRYLFEIGNDLKNMQTAMKLRGFRNCPGGMGTLAALAGTILARSYEQSERVYKAMVLRGYGQSASFEDDFQTAYPRGLTGLVAVILVAAAFVAAQLFLNSSLEVI